MASKIRDLVFMFVIFFPAFVFLGTEARACPPGWTLYTSDKTCLRLFVDSSTWSHAEDTCVYYYLGSLVVIKDAHKNAFVTAMTLKSQRKTVWMGARTPYSRSKPLIVDPTKRFSYHLMKNDIPGMFYHGCVSLSRGFWYYRRCLDKLPYVCQFPTENYG